MKMLIAETQAEALLAARKLSHNGRKLEKSRIFKAIKAEHGIPASTKIVLCVENPDNEFYRVIRDKRTRMPLDNGITEPVKAPVMAKSTAAKAPAKVAAKAPAKVAAKAPAKVAAKAPTQTGYPKDIRISHNGTRVRLGKAKDAAHEKRLIAAYKKAN